MKILLHLGFPKTMSSSLQFGLFKSLEKKGLVNLRTWRKDDPNEGLDVRPSSRLFNYQKIPKKYLDFEEGTLNILSDESFTAPLKLRRNNYGNLINTKHCLHFFINTIYYWHQDARERRYSCKR